MCVEVRLCLQSPFSLYTLPHIATNVPVYMHDTPPHPHPRPLGSSDPSLQLKPGDVIRVGMNVAVISSRPDAVTPHRIILRVGPLRARDYTLHAVLYAQVCADPTP